MGIAVASSECMRHGRALEGAAGVGGGGELIAFIDGGNGMESMYRWQTKARLK